MNQSYVYEEDENEEGLTFKKVGHFFKKGWLRMLIYVVALCLLTTAIAVPIKVFYKSEPVAQTSVEYIYEGIEKGLDPKGSALNTDNIISMQVLQTAVEESNLGGVINNITTLRNSMRVEGVETDEYVSLVQAAADGDTAAANALRNYTMHPTRFNIIISDPAGLGLSDDQAKLLLNKIVSAYYSDFQNRFYSVKPFSIDGYALSQNVQREFTDIYDVYTAELGLIKTSLSELDVTDTASAATFTQLLAELNILNSDYVSFNAYILSNKIWRDPDTARNNLVEKQTEINNELTALDGEISSLKEQISKIQPNTTTSGTGENLTIVQSYPEFYYELQANLYAKNSAVSAYQVQLANIETRLNKLNDAAQTDPALINSATQKLVALEAQTVEFVNKANSAIGEYYGAATASALKQVQSPVVTRRNNNLNLMIVYLVAVIAGLLAAGVVTAIKIAKANAKAKKDAVAADAKPQDGEENDNEKA